MMPAASRVRDGGFGEGFLRARTAHATRPAVNRRFGRRPVVGIVRVRPGHVRAQAPIEAVADWPKTHPMLRPLGDSSVTTRPTARGTERGYRALGGSQA